MNCVATSASAACVISVPFGRPIDPEVQIKYAQDSGPTATGGASAAAFRSAASSVEGLVSTQEAVVGEVRHAVGSHERLRGRVGELEPHPLLGVGRVEGRWAAPVSQAPRTAATLRPRGRAIATMSPARIPTSRGRTDTMCAASHNARS